MKNYKLNIIAIFSVILLNAPSIQAQTGEIVPMSGGSFTMTQSVIAAGGNSQRSVINSSAAIGQPVSGLNLSGNQLQHYTGFLLPESYGRMRASAVVGGRVMTAEGKGIRNAEVTITFENGETQTVKSGAKGYYSFAEIPIGKNFTVSVSANRFGFSRNRETRLINDDTQDINFIAEALAEKQTEKQ